MDLFESFNQLVDPEFISKLKSNISDNMGDVETALKGVHYTLVAGLIRRCNSDMSVGMLYNQVQEKYKKSGLEEGWTSKLSNSGYLNNIVNDGTKIISQIFPAYKSPLLSMIGSYAGTSKNTTVIVSGVTATVLIDYIGSKLKAEKWDKDQMVYFLKQHHEALLKEAPENLMEKMVPALGLQELLTTKIVPLKKPEPSHVKVPAIEEQPQVESKKIYNDEETENSGTFLNKKVLIALFAIIVLGGIAYFYWVTNGTFGLAKSETEDTEMVDEELQFADSLATAAADTVKKDSVKVVPVAPSELNLLTAYLAGSEAAGKSFDFKNIQYIDKTFELSSTSLPVVDSLVALMSANSNLQIKITAYSEEGDTKLNNKRAFAVKKVLISKGINTIRIDAASGGKGGNYPTIKVVSK